jgi:hypothetical protein
MAEMNKNNRNVNVDIFARENLRQLHDADDFRKFVFSHGVPKEFAKDRELIEKRIERLQIKFSSGAVVYFPLSALDGHSVSYEELDEERIQITIMGATSETNAKSLMGQTGRAKESE